MLTKRRKIRCTFPHDSDLRFWKIYCLNICGLVCLAIYMSCLPLSTVFSSCQDQTACQTYVQIPSIVSCWLICNLAQAETWKRMDKLAETNRFKPLYTKQQKRNNRTRGFKLLKQSMWKYPGPCLCKQSSGRRLNDNRNELACTPEKPPIVCCVCKKSTSQLLKNDHYEVLRGERQAGIVTRLSLGGKQLLGVFCPSYMHAAEILHTVCTRHRGNMNAKMVEKLKAVYERASRILNCRS